MEERTLLFPKLGNDASFIGRVGQITAGASGHEDFDARLPILLQQQRVATSLSGSNGGDQPGGPGADDHDLPGIRLQIRHVRDNRTITCWKRNRPPLLV